MANRRPKPEAIVSKLRQVEVLMGQGMPRLDAIRQIGVVEQTYYRWPEQYGGMGVDQLKELKRLQKENERLWRREGLKVPAKQPKKGRLWLNDGSCVRLRAEYRNHVWSYDFVHCRTDDGKVFRTLSIIDEFSRECPPLGRFGMAKSPAGQRDDQGDAQAELDGCDRCADRAVHPTWNTRVHTVRQWSRVRCPGGSRLDRRRRRKDGLHRIRIALGKRIL